MRILWTLCFGQPIHSVSQKGRMRIQPMGFREGRRTVAIVYVDSTNRVETILKSQLTWWEAIRWMRDIPVEQEKLTRCTDVA
ncbi:hypothetical protein FY534_13705 (plasmid) [Alicyclobacillus sp. TC]|uniref:Uncharacterized protein n=1 Tax=Alicyclobacillus tolerans TaxID=90970 RepID=A0ABT9LYI7_9BACL|nr:MULTISPECIES: hypothetical protein [Alicyclobacillus]MDP9729332.1 hypothetical protein [Alicyclobacillus tengchongensis]QRF24835.1 hypothetical protein FY534_13705 [Alicyclobacillus sp. TC]